MTRDRIKTMTVLLAVTLILLLVGRLVLGLMNVHALSRTGASLELDIQQVLDAEAAFAALLDLKAKPADLSRTFAAWENLLARQAEHKEQQDALRAAFGAWDEANRGGATGPSLKRLRDELEAKTDMMTREEEADVRRGAREVVIRSERMARLWRINVVLLFATIAIIGWLVRELLAESDRFKEIAQTIGEVFWMTSPTGDRMDYVSPAYEEIWCRDTESLYAAPSSWMESIIPADKARIQAAFLNFSQGFDEEFRIQTPRGEKWIRAKSTLVRDESGSVLRTVGIASDVTRQKALEEQLQASEERFRILVENAPDAFFLVDSAGKILEVNGSASKSLGYTRAELLTMNVLDIETQVDSQEVRAINAKAKAVGRVVKLGESRRKDGTTFPVEGSIGSVHYGGQPCGLALVRDISSRVRAERELRQSEKLASVGQLAAGIAHEINNPLGVILGFAQGMAKELKHDDALELPVRSIEREALRCKELVRSLLTFSRASQGGLIELELNAVIEQALVLVSPQAKMKRVRIVSSLAADLPLVLGDKIQLQQVIVNLSSNAIDAMPNGGTLNISSEKERTSDGRILLKVADEGTGIPSAVMSKIFEPFFTTKPLGQGTGLGLSLVREIVQKHNGEISAESRPGRTEFVVKLPVASEALKPAGKSEISILGS